MKTGPDISRIAALMGDPARSNMLLALMDGRALTASELAAQAGITRQTASSHLAQLLAAQLLARDVQGRHHYYRLKGPDVAHTIEALLGLAQRGDGARTRTGPKDPALRKARICYDHLAGELGVWLFDQMAAKSWFNQQKNSLSISTSGWKGLALIGITQKDLPATRRPECKTCLDWSMRRHHLAGTMGQILLNKFIALKWAKRTPETRIIVFSKAGEIAFRKWLA